MKLGIHHRDIGKLPQGFQPGEAGTRLMSVENIDKDKRTLELSFSSDAEIKRWGIIEVLDHSPGAVDLSRLNQGGPLLFNHDLDEVLGVIERAWLDGTGKGRALVRFSKREDAEEVWQDVQDGILRNVSVGYRINEIKLKETRDDGTDVYVATKWEPYEISIVTAPADSSVGVGRSNNTNNSKPENPFPMKDKLLAACKQRGITLKGDETEDQLLELLAKTPEPTPAAAQRSIQVGEDHSDAVKAERKRMADITEAAKKLKLVELGERFVTEGKSVDEFRAAALDEVTKRGAAFRESHTPIGLNDKEQRSFSFLKLMRTLADPQNKAFREEAAFELEVTSAARSHRKSARGTVIPVDVLRAPIDAEALAKRDIVSIKTGSGYTGTGGNTVETTLLSSNYYELLRNRTSIMRLGRILGGLVGDIDIPRQATNAENASWIGEDDQAPMRDMTFGSINLSPKTVAAYGAVTRKMLMQSSLDVEALLRADLAQCMGQAIDVAGYYGNGANTPTGIRFTNGINAVFFAGTVPTWTEIVNMETELAEANLDPASARYVHNARMRGSFKTTKKVASSSTETFLWEGNGINGYASEVTNQIQNNHLFFGDFNELIIGMWGGLDILVDPYTESRRGRILVNNFQDVDFEVRRPEAFTFGLPLAQS